MIAPVIESAPSKPDGTPLATAGSVSTMNSSRGSVARSESYVDESHSVPVWKRILDIACIVMALPVLLPIMILVGLLIKVLSDGPVLFKQERIGFRGRSFVCLKFRTMAVGADSLVHRMHLEGLIGSNSPMTKMDLHGDERLIPLGLLLRVTGLDELPQIINVVRGEMSLVGPRPCLCYECDQYLPWQTERFNALPGLTGLWQVSGKNRTTFDEMMRLDIRYARSQSLWLDVKIILKTIPALMIQVQDTRRQRKRRATVSLVAAGRFPASVGAAHTADRAVAVPAEQLAQSSTEERV
jgi:lipopolysaccharide/colanic/teichoic acid biosynthesis glycosyltransferase